MQLQDYVKGFEEAGIGVIAITYDAPELQQAFIDANSITYPLLSDIEASSVKALAVLNDRYEPGEPAYGIPYPGIFIVDAQQMIVGKVFVEAVSKRVGAGEVLDYAMELLE